MLYYYYIYCYKSIYNFTICYIKNTFPVRKNLAKWEIYLTVDCSFCLFPETLSCGSLLSNLSCPGWIYLRYDSILHFLAKFLQGVKGIALFVDLPNSKSPSIITGESLRSDLMITSSDNCLYVLELSVGFQSN